MICDPRIPPGGSIGPGGVILDADGKPVLGADGKPLLADPAAAAAAGHPSIPSFSPDMIPPGGSIGAGGIILDANGNPVLGADGKPLIATWLVPPGGSIGPGGVVLDGHGRQVQRAQGCGLDRREPHAAAAAAAYEQVRLALLPARL